MNWNCYARLKLKVQFKVNWDCLLGTYRGFPCWQFMVNGRFIRIVYGEINYTSTLTSWEALTILFDSRTNMDQRPHSEAVRPGKLAARLKPRRTTPPFLWSVATVAINKKTEKSKSVGRFFKVEIFQQTLPFRNPSPNRVSGPFRKQLDILHSLKHNQTKRAQIHLNTTTAWQFPRVPMRFLGYSKSHSDK